MIMSLFLHKNEFQKLSFALIVYLRCCNYNYLKGHNVSMFHGENVRIQDSIGNRKKFFLWKNFYAFNLYEEWRWWWGRQTDADVYLRFRHISGKGKKMWGMRSSMMYVYIWLLNDGWCEWIVKEFSYFYLPLGIHTRTM